MSHPFVSEVSFCAQTTLNPLEGEPAIAGVVQMASLTLTRNSGVIDCPPALYNRAMTSAVNAKRCCSEIQPTTNVPLFKAAIAGSRWLFAVNSLIRNGLVRN